MPRWFNGLRLTRRRIAPLFSAATPAQSPPTPPTASSLEDLRDLLITTDVPPRLAEALIREIHRAATRRESPRQAATRFLTTALAPPPHAPSADWTSLPSPAVILLLGINGAGKTTTAAKLALHAKNAGRHPLLGAADTYRPAGAVQLKLWADRLSIPAVIGETGADAAATAYDALAATRARHLDTLILDTAGRMHTQTPLMHELPKLVAALQKQLPTAPHRTWLILDALLGQNAISQARLFRQTLPLDGVIVTKLDGSSKAGFLFAIRQELGLPILYAGLGEQPEDLTPFDPAAFVQALLA